MKVLIIGYGSIGRRHEGVLRSFPEIDTLDIVSKQAITHTKSYKNLQQVENLNGYDYFVIASETYKHFEQVEFIESKVEGKKIFCEKPLFSKYQVITILKNTLLVGYVLRFHPLLQKLKKELNKKQPVSLNVYCGQYLPSWRPDSDYRKSYSADVDQGGGVLLDLSHEIDYVYWLSGKFESVTSIVSKVSNLEINSDDSAQILALTKSNTVINISLNYLDKCARRMIIVNTNEYSYRIDLIKNKYTKYAIDTSVIEECTIEMERNQMFHAMHKDVLDGTKVCCDLNDGLYVMEVIDEIRRKSL